MCKVLEEEYLNWEKREDFDFIECFTTTFMRAHSWLNWVEEKREDNTDELPPPTG